MKSGVICITSTVPGLKQVPGEWPPLVMVATAVVLVAGGGSLRDAEAPTGSWGRGRRRERGQRPLRCDNPASSGLCPQAGGAVLCSTHQLPLGGAVQVLGLQQGRVRPLRVLLTATPVPQELQRDPEQGPPPAVAPLLRPHPGLPQPEHSARLRVKPVAPLESLEGGGW